MTRHNHIPMRAFVIASAWGLATGLLLSYFVPNGGEPALRVFDALGISCASTFVASMMLNKALRKLASEADKAALMDRLSWADNDIVITINSDLIVKLTDPDLNPLALFSRDNPVTRAGAAAIYSGAIHRMLTLDKLTIERSFMSSDGVMFYPEAKQ